MESTGPHDGHLRLGFEPRWDCSVYCLVRGVMEVSTSTPWANFVRLSSV